MRVGVASSPKPPSTRPGSQGGTARAFGTTRAGRIETPQETEIVAELSRDHLTMLWSRRTANVVRRNRYQLTSLISMPTVLVIAAELIVAVAARLE